MTAAKHTPGPWRAGFHHEGNIDYGDPHSQTGCGYGANTIYDANNRMIAGVCAVAPNEGPNHRNGTLSKETFECLDANVAIIAIAPQMLEMLKGILPEFRAYVETERDQDIRDRNESWIDGIEALIAKAEGGAA